MIYLYYLDVSIVRIHLDGEHDIDGLNMGSLTRRFTWLLVDIARRWGDSVFSLYAVCNIETFICLNILICFYLI